MRTLVMRLAVALNTAMLLALTVGACSVEHEDGVVDLGECDCTVKAVIWVNSQSGGIITCNGESWTYTQGARVYPICLDSEAEGFTVSIQATGETWAEAWVIEQGPDDTPAYLFWRWVDDTPPPVGWPGGPHSPAASEAYLPSGGTVDVVVPASQPGD